MEEQIQKAQEKVIKTKAAYDTAVESLQKLLDKRDAQRKGDLREQTGEQNERNHACNHYGE